MASINDFGGASPDTLLSPPLGGPSGWAAAVAAALNGSDTTVDARITAAIAAHLAAADPHPTYSTAAEVAAAIAAHAAAADPHAIYMTVAEHAMLDHTGIPGVGAGGGGVGPRIWYQPEPPVDPGDGDVWIDSDSVGSPGSGGSGGGGALTPVYTGTATAAGTFSLPAGTLDGHRRHRILVRIENASEDLQVNVRLRAAGVDDSTSGHYNSVRLIHYSSTGGVESNVLGNTFWGSVVHCDETEPAMSTIELDSASLATKTLFESFAVSYYYTTGNLQCRNSGRHSQEIAYDSLTFVTDVGTCDWVVDVFAYDETATGGGGASAYADLTDVDVTGLVDGDVPVWDETLSKWVPAAAPSGGGGALRPVASGDVTAAAGISLPAGAFTVASRRYLLQLALTPSADCEMRVRERAAGTDDTGAEYGFRNTVAGNDAGMGAYPSPGYTDSSIGIGWGLDGGRKSTWDIVIDGPALAENTTFSWMSTLPYWVGATSVINGWGSAEHRDPTAYDSLTVYPSTGDITGHWALFAYDETIPTPIVGQSRLWTPEIIHPQSDEFRDGAIGAEWIHVDAATAGNVTWAEGGDCLSILLNGGDDAGPALHGLMKPYALAVGEYIQFHVRHMGWQYNYPAVGLCIADGATAGAGNQIVSMGIRSAGFTGVSQALFTGYNTRVAGYLDVGDDRIWPSFHMRILRYASDVWRFFLSADGVSWVAMNTAYTRTYAMTPTHIGIIATNWGGGAVAGAQFSVDYFRVGS